MFMKKQGARPTTLLILSAIRGSFRDAIAVSATDVEWAMIVILAQLSAKRSFKMRSVMAGRSVLPVSAKVKFQYSLEFTT